MDEHDRRYAWATHTVMFLINEKEYNPEDAAYRAAMIHGLGLNQFATLTREAKERYND